MFYIRDLSWYKTVSSCITLYIPVGWQWFPILCQQSLSMISSIVLAIIAKRQLWDHGKGKLECGFDARIVRKHASKEETWAQCRTRQEFSPLNKNLKNNCILKFLYRNLQDQDSKHTLNIIPNIKQQSIE